MLVDNYVPIAGYAPTAGEMMGAVGRGINVGMQRPYLDSHDRPCVTINTGRWTVERGQRVPLRERVLIRDLINNHGIIHPVFNAVSMRKEDWIRVDATVVRAARLRLTAWNDLAAANTLGGFNGMAKLTLEYEAMTDPGEAVIDMDGIADARQDSPLFKLRSLPLPITHSDFWYSQRRIDISGNSNTPLDMVSAEAAGRRVGESVEKVTIGVDTGITYGTQTGGITAHDGTSTVYGYTNYPYRQVVNTLHTPDGTNPSAILEDILNLIEILQTSGHYGPYSMYHSTGYTKFLNDDYFRAGSTSAVRSLRARIMESADIVSIRRLDYLTSNYQIVLVDRSPEVAQAVNGMELTTVQWPSQGGMRQNFKVMCIKVPLLKAPYNGVAAILHATTPTLS